MNTENNKIIAEFMGFTFEKNIGYYDNDMLLEQIIYDQQNGNCFDELLFDKSWDWLMPTVAKIEQIENVYDMEEFLLIRDELCTGRIKTVYQQVVSFLEWHNNQKN